MSCKEVIPACDLKENRGVFLLDECNNDPRRNSRSLTIATDLDGERIYSRMDNYLNLEVTDEVKIDETDEETTEEENEEVTDEDVEYVVIAK